MRDAVKGFFAVRPRALRRTFQLTGGLVLLSLGVAMQVRSQLGLAPWDVLHQGLARAWGLSLGTMVIIVSLAVLVLWIPIKQKPGLGTLANAVLLGLGIDLWLALVPVVENLAVEIGFVSVGIALSAVGTALYIGAGLGPGARDGLMTGFAARGFSLRKTRMVVELSVLLCGWLIGGTVGVGTVLFALAIGPMVQVVLPRVSMVGLKRSR